MKFYDPARLKYLLGLILIGGGLPTMVWGINTIVTGYKTTTAYTEINAHGVCKKVAHSGGSAYFIPTKTATEWATFRNNSPSDLAVVDCAYKNANFLYHTLIATYYPSVYAAGNINISAVSAEPKMINKLCYYAGLHYGTGWTVGVATGNGLHAWSSCSNNEDYTWSNATNRFEVESGCIYGQDFTPTSWANSYTIEHINCS